MNVVAPLKILTTLVLSTSVALAAGNGGGNGGGGNGGGGNGGGQSGGVDDNPSASDLYLLQYLAEKEDNADLPELDEVEIEAIKLTPPPAPIPEVSGKGSELLAAWLAPDSGITVTSPVDYQGGSNQARTYASAEFPTVIDTSGIVLTTGMADFANFNSSSGATGVTGSGASYEISKLSKQQSFDANALRFDFTVAAGVNAVSTQFVFASEEYPEWTGIFKDGFALLVDGVNYARFNASNFVVLDDCSTNGVFPCTDSTQNDNGFLTPNSGDTAVPFEFDGYTSVLTVDALLNLSLAQHTLEVVISDSRDALWDSAVFLSRLHAATLEGVNSGEGVTTVPLPATAWLLLTSLGSVGMRVSRRRLAA